jgi:hypothetical protein
MKKFKDNNVPFFVLCGPQHQQKMLCVVLDTDDNTLQVTCLTSQETFHAEFRHIWEMILDAPVLPVELRSSMPMPYAKAAKIQIIAVNRAALDVVIDVTIENVAPAQVPYQRVNPDAPWTDDKIADCRIRQTNAMTERHQLEAILAPRSVPRNYLHSVVLQNSMRRTVKEITDQIPYHYMATVRQDCEQNQTIQAAAAPSASTIANAAPAQATCPQDRSVTPLTDQGNEDNEARRIKAVRVSLRLNRDQAAQVEPTQPAQDCLPWVTSEGISVLRLLSYDMIDCTLVLN